MKPDDHRPPLPRHALRSSQGQDHVNTLDVLIPHFNDPGGLALSLASIAAQSWTGDLQVIVADDGSPADVLSEVKRIIAASGLSVRLLRSDLNLGRPRTRNRLLEATESRYIAWLDAGDVWYPEKLDRQFATLERLAREGVDTSRVWITCDYDWQWEGQPPRPVTQQVEGDQLKELLLGDRLRCYLWTLLAPAEAFRRVGSFDEDLPRLQDVDFFLRFVEAGGRIIATDSERPLCRYHKSDIGRNAVEIWNCNRRIMSKNRHLLARYQGRTVRRIRFKAGNLSARYALHNRQFLRYLLYKTIATVHDPRYAAFRAKRKFLGN